MKQIRIKRSAYLITNSSIRQEVQCHVEQVRNSRPQVTTMDAP
jgi:hypothetical protein